MVAWYRCFFSLSLILFCSARVLGQLHEAETAAVSAAVKEALVYYHEAVGLEAAIYSGAEYHDQATRTEGHPFFKHLQWENADVLYRNILYEQVPLQFDVVTETLVLGRANEAGLLEKINIDKWQVSHFTFYGHHFQLLPEGNGLAAGIYDRLYDGQVKVVAKRKKIASKTQVVTKFSEDDTYFIWAEGQYHPVKSRGSVMKLFKKHKRELAKTLQESNLTFPQNREQALVLLATQYDLLTK